ncbi:uncharacterized protein EV422DRAFT_531193 [Fimicolochytrium jonesii]|uniref:uncharacterized protein n=1 Tax=Fimicolochytrium jonesii TaxID=1396493 RepID=UPI0022FEF2EF|nr:uncharacterized protein EV422DRAFT_531193 [Fimicolochytrium jonesii]KAI8820526.1 hypothetical protein EV422DRAFT_531193 [Fimicolochytrium jonesii]
MSSENPPSYEPNRRFVSNFDAKNPQHTADYNVGPAGAQSFYPSANEYVPPTAEPSQAHTSYPNVGNSTSYPNAVEQHNGNYPTAPPVSSAPLPTPQQQSTYNVPTTVPATQAVVYGETVNLHFYREGWVSRDCRILAGDKKNMAYHIEYPYSFFGSWHVNMRRSGPKGPTIFLIKKSAIGSDFTIEDPVNTNQRVKLIRSGGVIGKRKHAFMGSDGKQYAWKGNNLGGDLKLVCYPQKTVAAFFNRTKHAWAKEGRLEILPSGQHIMDLIVATGFCVEEWERQNR